MKRIIGRNFLLITSHLLFTFIILCAPAYGWLRPHYEDATIVERSELIVVGRLKEGSIRYIPEQISPAGRRSWHHQAILIITEVLKGKLTEREIPIIIHYGLTPVVGGYVNQDGFMMDLRGRRADYPKDIIEIIDTGNSVFGLEPLVKDAREDNLWFLRRDSKPSKKQKAVARLGITDPEDFQPLELKDYFLAYMGENPEEAVRQQVAQHPELTKRAEHYFDHLEVQRIFRLTDTKERIEKLLPFYIKGSWWNMEREARRGIIDCGKVSGPYLLRLFNETPNENLKEDIILAFGEIGFEGCVDTLIGVLEEQDKFWATQILDPGWWNTDFESELTRRRRNSYGLVYYSVSTLGKIGNGRAREAVAKTKQRWEAINFDNPQIIEACNEALKVFAKRAAISNYRNPTSAHKTCSRIFSANMPRAV